MRQHIGNFSLALIVLTLLLSAAVAFDLGYRGLHRHAEQLLWRPVDVDAERGRQALTTYGCGGCHVIPGVRQATGRAGPRLDDFVHQTFIAGVLPNRGDNLAAWIVDPPAVNPRTAMPNLGVSEAEARDMAYYLYRH